MQSKSTFLEFLRDIHRYKFGPPKKFFRGEIIQAFSVLSLDCASLFIYVYEHDRLYFPMLTEETAVFDWLHLLT